MAYRRQSPDYGPMAGSGKQAHKVVMESVTQGKKKLHSELTFKTKPPAGYTFIPAGNPELTNALKEFARQANEKIFAVSATKHHDTHDLSKEVHRVGFHFPTSIVDEVCAHYGIVLSSAGTLLRENDVQDFRRVRRKGRQGQAPQKDQVTINTEARDAIKDLFPSIPDRDLFQIIKTAFQRGQKRVGTAEELSLVRRAQLSVVAHVRHVYTKYDSLLRKVQWNEARGMVEGPTLRKLVEWRGDDNETGKEVLEDVLREVIVISDDGESEDEADPHPRRRQSGGVVSRKIEPEIIDLIPIDYAQKPTSNGQAIHDYSDEDVPNNFQQVARVDRPRPADDQRYMAKRADRYNAWDRAREQYRTNPAAAAPNGPQGPLARHDHNQTAMYHQAQNPFQDTEVIFERPYQPREVRLARPPQEPIVLEPSEAPALFRGADGALYRKALPQSSNPQYATRRSPPRVQPAHSHHEGDQHVLPSIERDENNDPVRRTQHIQMAPERYQHYPATPPRNANFVDLTDSTGQRDAKRRRIEDPVDDRPAPIQLDGGVELDLQPTLTDRRFVSRAPVLIAGSSQYSQQYYMDDRPRHHLMQRTDMAERSHPPQPQQPFSSGRDLVHSRSLGVLRRLDEPHLRAADHTVDLSSRNREPQSLQSPRLVSESGSSRRMYLPPLEPSNRTLLRRQGELAGQVSFDRDGRQYRMIKSDDRDRLGPERRIIELPSEHALTSQREPRRAEAQPQYATPQKADIGREIRYEPRDYIEYVEGGRTIREYLPPSRVVSSVRHDPIDLGAEQPIRRAVAMSGSSQQPVYIRDAPPVDRRYEALPPPTYVRN